ncbi:MAG: type II toxin-antitoxin system RelE/ParE family toxin [Acidobacteriota bacterium]
MPVQPRGLQIYETLGGKRPFQEWLDSLKDDAAQGRILARLERVRLGLLGDCRFVGDGVSELRIDAGPGYRVYFGQEGRAIVILLCGGSKAIQRSDIRNALAFWKDYRSRKDAKKRTVR